MPSPLYLGTFQECLGEGSLFPDGLFAQEVLSRFSPVKEYYLGEEEQILWRVPDIREAVRAPKGKKIFSADYSQIEIRLMAWLSQDPFLISVINAGGDFHSRTASEIYGIPYEEFILGKEDKSHPKHKEYSAMRSGIKTTVFGIPYGAGVSKVALMTGLSEEEAGKVIESFFAKASVLKAWLDRIRKEAVQNRCSRSPRGRVRRYDVPPRSDENYRKILAQIERYAGNHPIQSGCVDLLKPAMAKFYLSLRNDMWNGDKIYPHAALLLAVHDELVGECDEEDAGHTCDCKKTAPEEFKENNGDCVRDCLGPVPKLLKKAMEDSYNELSTLIDSTDEEGKPVKKKIWIREIPNKVDVVVNDYWSKD